MLSKKEKFDQSVSPVDATSNAQGNAHDRVKRQADFALIEAILEIWNTSQLMCDPHDLSAAANTYDVAENERKRLCRRETSDQNPLRGQRHD